MNRHGEEQGAVRDHSMQIFTIVTRQAWWDKKKDQKMLLKTNVDLCD